MRRLIWLVVLELLGFAVAASAQSVSPLVAEGGKGKAKGAFTVTNNGVQPLLTTVEAVSFRFSAEGKPVWIPVDPAKVSVKVDQSSFKVGPRQTHTVSYDIECHVTPCTVALLPRMVQGVHIEEGVQVGVIIPHAIYLCDKAKGCRDSIRKSYGVK